MADDRQRAAAVQEDRRDAEPRRSSIQSDDIRGGMGIEGLAELAKFVQEGGTLITEGSTATIFPEYGITTRRHRRGAGAAVRARLDPARQDRRPEEPDRLRLRRQRPAGLLQPGAGVERRRRRHSAGSAAFAAARRRANAGLGQNVTPNAQPLRISPFEPDGRRRRPADGERPQADDAAQLRQHGARSSASRIDDARPRVVLSFPPNPNDMLLSGTLANGQFLANRAAAVDVPLGKGHVVMFAIRPFWRWQTQGTYSLGFNAIMNWNDLDAGKAAREDGREDQPLTVRDCGIQPIANRMSWLTGWTSSSSAPASSAAPSPTSWRGAAHPCGSSTTARSRWARRRRRPACWRRTSRRATARRCSIWPSAASTCSTSSSQRVGRERRAIPYRRTGTLDVALNDQEQRSARADGGRASRDAASRLDLVDAQTARARRAASRIQLSSAVC